jgi:hypothetical protein
MQDSPIEYLSTLKDILVNLGLELLAMGEMAAVEAITRLIHNKGLRHE